MASDRFVFEAGNHALDLANTLPISGGEPVERLADAGALGRWLAIALGESGAPAPDEALLAEARALRDAIRGCAEARVEGRPPPADALEAINRVLGSVQTEVQVAWRDGALARHEIDRPRGAVAVLVPIARAAVELLDEVPPERIRQCADDDCVLWFVDRSRNNRRRWCSMATCGNRNKVAAHYRRTQQP